MIDAIIIIVLIAFMIFVKFVQWEFIKPIVAKRLKRLKNGKYFMEIFSVAYWTRW